MDHTCVYTSPAITTVSHLALSLRANLTHVIGLRMYVCNVHRYYLREGRLCDKVRLFVRIQNNSEIYAYILMISDLLESRLLNSVLPPVIVLFST